MKIAFWGLGSIAKRHLRNFTEILEERAEGYQIDIIRHERKAVEDAWVQDLVSGIYLPEEVGQAEYDIAFITNPTALHYETIQKSVGNTKHLFIEKPAFETCNVDIRGLGLKEGHVYYVACPLRHTVVFQYLKQNIHLEAVLAARAISSSYLPDWRPGIDYRNTYSASKHQGGGVALDLIHEWDYLISLFGFPNQVLYAGGRFSNLEIDTDDLASYLGIYDDKIIELHLDYFGMKTIRGLMLLTSKETIFADFVSSKIIFEPGGRVINLPEERDQYQKRELGHFLDIINGKCENDNSIEHALAVLKVASNQGEGV